MENISTITIGKLIEQSEEIKCKSIKIGNLDGQDIFLNIKKALTEIEYYSVCAALATAPFAETDGDGSAYVPTSEISAFKVALARNYIINLSLPDDITEAYHLCAKLNVFSALHSALKYQDQYRDLLTAAERYSEYHRMCSSGLTNIYSVVKRALKNLDFDALLQNIASELGVSPESVENVKKNFKGGAKENVNNIIDLYSRAKAIAAEDAPKLDADDEADAMTKSRKEEEKVNTETHKEE